MRKTKRLLAVGIVGAVVIAACVGSLTLSETEQRTMSYPGSASAGNVVIGQSGTTPAIVFTPATAVDSDTILSLSENCTRWTLNLPSLPVLPALVACMSGSQTCVPTTYSFTGTFTPSGPGPDSCAVTVAYRSNPPVGSGSGSGSGSSNTQTLVIVLNGTGVAPSYAMTVTPAAGTALEYTDIPINTTSTKQQITVTNTGTGALTVTGTNTDPARFPVTSVAGSTFASQPLGVGASAKFDVACNPLLVQSYTATITFQTTPGNLMRSVGLVCNGITSNLVIDPNPAGFARNTLVGAPPADLVINVTNSGAETMFMEVGLTTGGEVSVIGAPMSPLANGGSTTIVLRYTAATEHPFGRIDNLVITHDPGGTRTIAINAEALVGEIGVTPALVDFGPVCPNSEKTSDLMVYATSSGPVNLTSITQPDAPFMVSGTGGQLAPNHGNIISLTARVSATTAGKLDDKFTLNTNIPGAGATHDVQLTGVALPAGVTPTPNVVHFGPGQIRSPTIAKRVTVSNCGESELAITGAHIEGPNAAEFAIVAPEDPGQTIPMMGELEFLVIMNPSTPGTKIAQLVVEHAGGTIEADLDGNGFGAGDDGGEKTTYYACNAGGAGGLPIAFALLLMRRRRRATA